MSTRGPFSILRWLSLLLLLLALVITVLQLVRYSRLRSNFPPGLSIAGIPVGQLNRQEAAARLLEVFSQPVEVFYKDSTIQISPGAIGFELDLDAMLAVADMERTRIPFWEAFWNFLWDRPISPIDVPLRANYSEDRLRSYLVSEISPRYDQPPVPAQPAIGTVNFVPGKRGTTLDVDQSILLIENALHSTASRTVDLPLRRTDPERPTFGNLDVLLNQTIELAGYDGVIGLYVADLQSGQEIYLLKDQGENVSQPPDLAFSASSTIKIPIMVSAFRRLENPDPETVQNLEAMIGKSDNTATDWIMQKVIEQDEGPLIVTEDIQSLGFENTFLAGYFYTGAPLLKINTTPANSRADISTQPDPYNQTTPAEIGQLLVDIYLCAHDGSGALIAAFPTEITQAECQEMINNLIKDKIALLIQAGVPDGTNVAHKHGWVTDPFGIIHDISDAAIVYTPGGNYVLSIFLYHPIQLVFEPSEQLIKDLSRAIFNYYNLPNASG